MLILLLALAWLSQSAAQQDTLMLNEESVAEGYWESPVHESDLRGLPAWNPDVNEAPILSPAEAVRAATQVMGGLSLNKTWPDRWRVGSVTLKQIRNDMWLYVVCFADLPPPCDPPPGFGGCGVSWAGGPTSGMHIIVLPNGHAIRPIPVKHEVAGRKRRDGNETARPSE